MARDTADLGRAFMAHPLFDIAGRVALVTGSSRGIGHAVARGLAEAGCTVVLNSRDGAATKAAAEELAAATGASTHAEAFDVTDGEAVAAAVDRIESTVGPIDILVNNAGTQFRAPLTEFPDHEWDRVMATNLTSAFRVGREVARRMVPRGKGKIVNICSLLSEQARAGVSPYAASKGGLKMLTKGMCADLGPHGIQVNGVSPGYFTTELNAALVADAEFDAWVRRHTPAGRWGDVHELIGAVLFLCSPAADFVNGHLITVDGGMSSVL